MCGVGRGPEPRLLPERHTPPARRYSNSNGMPKAQTPDFRLGTYNYRYRYPEISVSVGRRKPCLVLRAGGTRAHEGVEYIRTESTMGLPVGRCTLNRASGISRGKSKLPCNYPNNLPSAQPNFSRVKLVELQEPIIDPQARDRPVMFRFWSPTAVRDLQN